MSSAGVSALVASRESALEEREGWRIGAAPRGEAPGGSDEMQCEPVRCSTARLTPNSRDRSSAFKPPPDTGKGLGTKEAPAPGVFSGFRPRQLAETSDGPLLDVFVPRPGGGDQGLLDPVGGQSLEG